MGIVLDSTVLIAAERALLSPQGLPNRPWFRHLIYAPGQYTGYAAVVIPGVNESIDAKDAPLTAAQLQVLTDALNRAAGVLDGHQKPPRIHDLRHSFAVEVLRRSYRAGENPQAVVPRLSRFMGHVTPACTHYYLKFTEQLQVVAGERFRRHIADSLLASADQGLGRKGGVR